MQGNDTQTPLWRLVFRFSQWIGRPHVIAAGAFCVLSLFPVFWLALAWGGAILAGDQPVLAASLPSERSLRWLANSTILAGAVSLLSAVVGTSLAFWLSSGSSPIRRVAGWVFLLPLLVPPYIHALAWMAIGGRRQLIDRWLGAVFGQDRIDFSLYGFSGTVLILTLSLFPIVTLLARSALQSIQPELLEAASLTQPPWKAARHIVLPLVGPAVLGGAGVVLVLALVEYGVPSLLQYNAYPLEIYAAFAQDGDPSRAFAVSTTLLIPLLILLAFSQVWLRASPLREQPGASPAVSSKGWPWPPRLLLAIAPIWWVIGVGVPLAVLIGRGGAPPVLAAAAGSASREIGLSIAVAALAGLLATLIALPVAQALVRSGSRHSAGWALCALPMAIPVPLMGISLVHLWNQPWLNGIYHTPIVLVAAHAGRLLPFAVFAAASQLRYLDPLLAEAAALPPVSAWRRLWWVSAPLAAPAATVAWLVVFLFSLGELGVSLLVAPPGYATLSMRIYNLLHYGATDLVAGMSLIVLTIGLGAAILLLMARRWLWLRMI